VATARDQEHAARQRELRLADRLTLERAGPLPRDADTDRGAIRRVEGVDEGIVVLLLVERVDPATVRGRGTGDRVPVHEPAGLALVGDHAWHELSAAEVVGLHLVPGAGSALNVVDQVQPPSAG